MVENLSLLFKGAGAETGAGEKITQSRSKTDRFRNTDRLITNLNLTPKNGDHFP